MNHLYSINSIDLETQGEKKHSYSEHSFYNKGEHAVANVDGITSCNIYIKAILSLKGKINKLILLAGPIRAYDASPDNGSDIEKIRLHRENLSEFYNISQVVSNIIKEIAASLTHVHVSKEENLLLHRVIEGVHYLENCLSMFFATYNARYSDRSLKLCDSIVEQFSSMIDAYNRVRDSEK